MVKSLKHPNWAMHSPEMFEQLGLRPGQHLPDAGLPPREINGVIVRVVSKYGSAGRRHRVLATCPKCSREMSAGRLTSQHAKHCKGEAS